MSPSSSQRLFAEFLGSGFLLATVIGSGVMGERLAGGNDAIALLANTLATGTILAVLITTLGPVSGAHLNPVVSLVFWFRKELSLQHLPVYLLAQFAGAIAGGAAAHLMFDLPVLQFATKARSGSGQWFAEFVATFGLLATILGALRARPNAVAASVGLYITAAYWFTASTSFANPAVTIARAFSDTFAGIRAADVAPFLVAQVFGALCAYLVSGWLFGSLVGTGEQKPAVTE